ncbi:hypothetical protein QR680_015198 [Steinernema hermaphroditum]|uniref:Cullin family profile domain-containing protein n=1 Tax=Steinernema hermaphroditum TaxID=289476 RepID=A0AA39IE34_9BILA|nr:hypothetical protein QR680_015198 [Steinernema hermaphroditum]
MRTRRQTQLEAAAVAAAANGTANGQAVPVEPVEPAAVSTKKRGRTKKVPNSAEKDEEKQKVGKAEKAEKKPTKRGASSKKVEAPPEKAARSEDPNSAMAAHPKVPVLAELWEVVKVGLKTIYAGERLAVKDYMMYYSKVHDYCSNNQHTQQRHSRAQRAAAGTSKGGAEFVGADLYEMLEDYLKGYVTSIQNRFASLQNEDELLREYAREWQQYAFSSKVVDGLFRYLNRHWIKREKDDGSKTVHEVYTLCLYLWKNIIFCKNSEGVTKAAIQLVTRDRNGDNIQDELIKNVVDSLEQLGLEDDGQQSSGAQYGRPCAKENPGFSDEQRRRLRVYLENFEEELLNLTDVYYDTEAEDYLQNHSIVEYMVKVETRLKEEEDRVRRYLNMYSLTRIAYSLETVFISNKLEKLQGEFGILLAQDRDEDLARMYHLCSRVPGALDSLRTEFQSFVTSKGAKAINELENVENADPDPKTYIGAILSVHKRYNGLVTDAFKGEAGFVQAFDKACNCFVNSNKVTKRNPTVNKSAELLARYVDILLKKGGLKAGDEDIEDHLNNSITVFKYVEDKDIFQKFYTKMLAKRLTTDTSASEDAEGSMIAKLKELCGFEYTSKIQRMFTDIGLSSTLNEGFRASPHSEDLKCDFTALVLGSAAWPISATFTFAIPAVLEDCIAKFRTYYQSQHQGRKLTWVFNMSRGELQTTCFSRKYTLQTTTAQMAVLLKYNDALSHQFATLKAELQLPKDVILAVVQSFLKVGLMKLPDGATFSASLPESTEIMLNTKFVSKKMKVDIARLQVAKIEAKQEAEQMEKTIEEDRKMVIQAAIVRVMKMRKRVNHNALISEIIAQITARFTPKVSMVKKCIDILMEKEYMKRADGEKDLYEYIS